MAKNGQSEGRGEKEKESGRSMKREREIRQLCDYSSVCSEVKEINWRLMGEYGFANDKSIWHNVSIVLQSECNLASGVLDLVINVN